jgi:hypothetical protein
MQKYVIEYVIYTICPCLSSGSFVKEKYIRCIIVLGQNIETFEFEEEEFFSSLCSTQGE